MSGRKRTERSALRDDITVISPRSITQNNCAFVADSDRLICTQPIYRNQTNGEPMTHLAIVDGYTDASAIGLRDVDELTQAVLSFVAPFDQDTLHMVTAALLSKLTNERAIAAICERVCRLSLDEAAYVSAQTVDLLRCDLSASAKAHAIADARLSASHKRLRVARGLDKAEV